MAKYVYPAVFTPESIGGYSINFPDLPHCYTQGDDLKDGYEMAEDVAAIVLSEMEERYQAIPAPTNPAGIQLEPGEFVALIGTDTKAYMRKPLSRRISMPRTSEM